MTNIVISRIQHRRGRRENLPQPLLPAEVALTSDTAQAWIGQDPSLAVPTINVYADQLQATAQVIVDANVVETRFDENMTVTIFNTFVSELKLAGGVTLVDDDILWDDTYRGTLETFTFNAAGTGYSVNDPITAISATGSGFTGEVSSVGGGGEITGVAILTGGINYRSANTTFSITSGGGGASGTITQLAVTDIYGSTVHIAANPVVDVGNTPGNIDTTIDGLSATITNRLMGDDPMNNDPFGGTFSGNSLGADNHTEASNVVAIINRVNSTTPGQVTGLVFTNLNIEITGGGSSSSLTILDGTGSPQPIGFNTIPIYEIDSNTAFDIAHQGMLWHKDSGGTITFTCDIEVSIPQGASWAVHNDDSENLTIAEGAGVTISFVAAGSAPVTGDVIITQGGIATIYKYTDTEYWVWGDVSLFVQAPATLITVTDTADPTTFPVLVGNAVGDEAPLTDAALTYNATTGTLSATIFSGDLTIDSVSLTNIDISTEFTDDDVSFMTSAAVEDHIESFGYSTTVGTVTSSGTPLDNQVTVFTGGTDIDSNANFTWDASTLALTGAFDITGDLDVDEININATTISSTGGTNLLLTPFAGQQLLLDTLIIVDEGSMIGITTLGFDGVSLTNIDISTEFTDDDASLMTSAAVEDHIESFGYSTTTGTVTSSGTPLVNEVAVFTGGTDIDSDSSFTWDGTTLFATNVTGTTIGGITQAQLVDSAATETIAGDWTYSGNLISTGYFHVRTATDAELNAVANAINTAAGKIQGAMVYNSTTDNPVYAVGNADADIWVDGAGGTANTPV